MYAPAKTVAFFCDCLTELLDYRALDSIPLVFAAGSTSGDSLRFSVEIVDDSLVEGSEQFLVTVTDSTASAIPVAGQDTLSVAIIDNDFGEILSPTLLKSLFVLLSYITTNKKKNETLHQMFLVVQCTVVVHLPGKQEVVGSISTGRAGFSLLFTFLPPFLTSTLHHSFSMA